MTSELSIMSIQVQVFWTCIFYCSWIYKSEIDESNVKLFIKEEFWYENLQHSEDTPKGPCLRVETILDCNKTKIYVKKYINSFLSNLTHSRNKFPHSLKYLDS